MSAALALDPVALPQRPLAPSRPRLRLVPTGADVEVDAGSVRLSRRGRLVRTAGAIALVGALGWGVASRRDRGGHRTPEHGDRRSGTDPVLDRGPRAARHAGPRRRRPPSAGQRPQLQRRPRRPGPADSRPRLTRRASRLAPRPSRRTERRQASTPWPPTSRRGERRPPSGGRRSTFGRRVGVSALSSASAHCRSASAHCWIAGWASAHCWAAGSAAAHRRPPDAWHLWTTTRGPAGAFLGSATGRWTVRIGVDDAALAGASHATERAATLVAAVRLGDLAAAVAVAMPGSRSAALASQLAEGVDEVVRGVACELAVHADHLRTASIRYADTESDVAASAQTPGAA